MKNNFCNGIEATLGSKIRSIGFRLVPSFFKKGDYCVYVKRYSKNIGLYIICRDNRAKDGDVSIEFWIAPIQFPDDRIEVLNVGIKVVLYSDYDVSDKLMEAIGDKIVGLTENISSLAPLVDMDIQKPFIKNNKTRWFNYSKIIYEKINSSPETQEKVSELKKLAEDCINGKVSFEKLESSCKLLIGSLGENFFSDDLGDLESDEKGEILSEMIYSDVLIV
ncbi:MAG TPA: hypothetical protein VF941_19410 [Clostridia bacterium]